MNEWPGATVTQEIELVVLRMKCWRFKSQTNSVCDSASKACEWMLSVGGTGYFAMLPSVCPRKLVTSHGPPASHVTIVENCHIYFVTSFNGNKTGAGLSETTSLVYRLSCISCSQWTVHTNRPMAHLELALREAYGSANVVLSYSEAEGHVIGGCKDASQSLPPSHQRLTERIVGVTVHATVLLSAPVAQRQLLRWQWCILWGGGGMVGQGGMLGELRTCHQQYCHNPR